MSVAASSSYCYCASQCLRPSLSPSIKSTTTRKISSFTNNSSLFNNLRRTHKPLFSVSSSVVNSSGRRLIFAAASARNTNSNPKKEAENKKEEELYEEEEEELPWIQEKALDLVEFTGSVTQAIPGPRVGQSSFPWMLAVPLAYVGITFVFAFVKTIRKFNSPRELRRKLVSLFIHQLLVFGSCWHNFRL